MLVACEQAIVNALHASESTRVDHIFFYFTLVDIVKQKDVLDAWEQLSLHYSIDLIVCSTLAKTHGIEQQDNGPFLLAGLSEFYARLHQCKQIIQL